MIVNCYYKSTPRFLFAVPYLLPIFLWFSRLHCSLCVEICVWNFWRVEICVWNFWCENLRVEFWRVEICVWNFCCENLRVEFLL